MTRMENDKDRLFSLRMEKNVFICEGSKFALRQDAVDQLVAAPSKVKEITETPDLCNISKQPLTKFTFSAVIERIKK